ncbi:MAG: PQQ-binding-like beta-propeller repeat protein, partial [Candidatus Bipolaricaulia bacterium]
MEQGQIGVWSFGVRNGGGGLLEWSVASDHTWIIVEPQSGSLMAEEVVEVRVTIATAGLSPGRHRGRIVIDSNGGSRVGLIAVEVLPSGGLADSPWPAFHHDPQRTGRSLFRGPESPIARWAFETSGPIWSSPVIGADGTIYTTSIDGWLYALTPEGRPRWKLKLGGIIEASPALGRDGTIYVGFSNAAPGGASKGETIWAVELGRLTTSSPIIGKDGTIYVGGEKLFAINPDGSV